MEHFRCFRIALPSSRPAPCRTSICSSMGQIEDEERTYSYQKIKTKRELH